jgi:signal transduction histidine kinase
VLGANVILLSYSMFPVNVCVAANIMQRVATLCAAVASVPTITLIHPGTRCVNSLRYQLYHTFLGTAPFYQLADQNLFRGSKLEVLFAVGSNPHPGSVGLFQELSWWGRDKSIWITGLLIIFGLCVLAVYLQMSRRELKQAKDAQTRLTGSLIRAQEQERTRLAAELHDDFSQRLALLACGLESASEALPESLQTTKQELHELWNSASEIGADLHAISHHLHSATLETLGLVPGITTLCKEFTMRQGIQVAFYPENIPRAVPPDVALCLFRIVQEGLQNVKKHSAAFRAEVSLRKRGDKLLLSVRDDGCGFDSKDKRNKKGMGIQSMEERARFLGGHLEIHSAPGKGTTIAARVPLQPAQTH